MLVHRELVKGVREKNVVDLKQNENHWIYENRKCANAFRVRSLQTGALHKESCVHRLCWVRRDKGKKTTRMYKLECVCVYTVCN